jgi:hypothetical protein
MVYSESYLADKEEEAWSPSYGTYGDETWVLLRRKLGHMNTKRDKQIMAKFWEEVRKITRIEEGEEWFKYYDEMEHVHWWPQFKRQQLEKLCLVPGHNIVLFTPPKHLSDKNQRDWIQDLIYNLPMDTLNTEVDTLTAMVFLKDLFDADPLIRVVCKGKGGAGYLS